MDIENNPYEVRLGWQVDLNKSNFIGKEALARIKEEGVEQRLVGLKVGGEPIIWYNEGFYPVMDDYTGDDLGYVTSAFWSPNIGSNIALAVVPRTHWRLGTRVKVRLPKDGIVDAEVVRVPFFDPTQGAPQDGSPKQFRVVTQATTPDLGITKLYYAPFNALWYTVVCDQAPGFRPTWRRGEGNAQQQEEGQ